VTRHAQFQIRQYAHQHNMFKEGAYEIKIKLDNNNLKKKTNIQ